MRFIGLDRLWMTKVNLQKSSKWLEADDHHHPRYHRTCSSLDGKRATICCLRVSSNLLSLDDEGADNHEVSPHAIGPSSHDNKIVCRDNHKVSPHATRPSSHDSEGETFSWSRPEDVDISGKGADDHIGLCVSTGSLASSWRKVQITIRYLHMLPDPRVTIAKVRLFRGLGQKTLTFLGRVQMTTLIHSKCINLTQASVLS